MRENRLYGSEGGAAKAVPTPIGTVVTPCDGVEVRQCIAAVR
jgi:hypothetical protein